MPKIVNHEARKKSFTEAAKTVIASKGLEAARLTDVANILGATTGSLGHYFQDKQDLLDATLQRLVSDWEQRLSSEGTLLDVCSQYLPMDETSQQDLRVWVAFYSRALLNEEMATYIKDFLEVARIKLINYLKKYESKSEKEAQTIAVAIQTAVDGLALRALGDLANWPPTKQRAQLEETINRLVSADAAGQQFREEANSDAG